MLQFSEAVSVPGLFHRSESLTTREGAKNNSRFQSTEMRFLGSVAVCGTRNKREKMRYKERIKY